MTSTILCININASGPHQLGGELPISFELPAINSVVPFQYLGYIDNGDPTFQWILFKLHLFFPNYLNCEKIFVDYSNPDKPQVINRNDVELANTSYDDLKSDSEVVFEEQRFRFIQCKEFSTIGHAGQPDWIQYEDIPVSPSTGKEMQFLLQLEGGIKTKRTNVIAKDPYFAQFYNHMNFWIDGYLYVFIEPSTRIVCYMIQNS